MAGRDKLLGDAIARIGPLRRKVDDDLFCSVVRSIVGQQISTAAQITIWERMVASLGGVSPEGICAASEEALQSHGISFRKASYIREFAEKVHTGDFNLEALRQKPDEQVIAELSSLRGIGVWTAEMILTFCLQRPDIVSYGDLAILRGMRMLYHHRHITKELFEKYRRRYSPYGSVASLYLWAIAGGAIEGMRDYAPRRR